MFEDHLQTFVEKLRCQIEEEQRKYRSALKSNKEFWEIEPIKNNIQKLRATLEQIMNALRNFTPKKS